MDPGAGPVQRFAFELRKLRAEAGGITYRVLAQRAGYGPTTLSQAAAGDRLPTLSVTLAYVRACGGDPAEWEARWRQAVDEVAALGPRDGDERGEPPYKGLARFEAGDGGLFFGRDQLTTELLELLRRRRFAAVFGPSGSGKSSLLRAGLIPALQHTQDPGLRLAAIRILAPGDRPAHTHARVCEPGDTSAGAGTAAADTLIVVDQFEEVFTLCQDSGERARFIDMLLAARRPENRLRVLIAVRADFYGRCAEHRDLADALRDAHLLAGPMSPAELREVVVGPAAAAGLTVERALTARLVQEVADAPGGLPLLSHVLLETWRRRRGKALTMGGYEAAGRLAGAIAKTAEDVYRRFTEEQSGAARRVMLRLVAPGDGTPDTRRPAERRELQNIGGPTTAQVLEALTRARLLTQDDDTVDLAHEALLTAWPRLRGWIEADRERLRTHRKLTEAARAWEDLSRDPGALYRGSRLTTAHEHFGQQHRGDLTELEHAFLTTSLQAREHEEHAAARTTRRLRTLTASLSVLLVLAVVAGLVAWQQSRMSDRQRHDADTARQVALSRQLAAQSAGLVGTDSDLASLLAIRAYRTSPTPAALESLYAAAAVPLRYRLPARHGAVTSVAFSPDGRTLATSVEGRDGAVRLWDTGTGRLERSLTGHPAWVWAMTFSPDGRTLATAALDHGVQLWSPATGRLRTGLPGPRDAFSLAFSPDGHTLATAGDDRGVELWDTASAHLRRTLGPPTSEMLSVAYSPDGRTLATGGKGHELKLWDPVSGRLRRSLPAQPSGVSSVAFSPDGRTLATAGPDRTVRLWDPADGRLRTGLPGPADDTAPLAFSPDGRTLATTGPDHTVRLWDTATGTTRTTLTGHTDTVLAVAFGPDGHTLATAGRDQSVRLWDTADGPNRAVLPGPPGQTPCVAFGPDGQTLAAAGPGHGVDLWNTGDRRRRRTLTNGLKDVTWVVFSPDGRTLATLGRDRGVGLWNAAAGRLRRRLSGDTGDVFRMAFSPDGRTLATRGVERGVELWDAGTGRLRTTLPEFVDGTGSLAFSPDGRSLATGGDNGPVRLWDTATGRLRTHLPGHADSVESLAFSPDGRTLAVAGDDGTVRLWDTKTRRVRTSLPGRAAPGFAIVFSPDGRTLVTAGSSASTVRLWDAATGNPLATLAGHTGTVLSVAFSPDGRTLATAGGDRTVRLWNVLLPTPAAAIGKLCRALGRDLTPQERSTYLPDQPPHPTCPA
ncbi:nSTAND1 domain-containing NTPase [Streptomyces filipinensis]|uniref:nSTAND1 domain-containing NTPase n=1 Tax=Streptomyces filipinensis TaxID=66887 RepID=UPI001E5C26C5|nr:helix-turn-helix domain-containing protein [Streptomyces filipinensis]